MWVQVSLTITCVISLKFVTTVIKHTGHWKADYLILKNTLKTAVIGGHIKGAGLITPVHQVVGMFRVLALTPLSEFNFQYPAAIWWWSNRLIPP